MRVKQCYFSRFLGHVRFTPSKYVHISIQYWQLRAKYLKSWVIDLTFSMSNTCERKSELKYFVIPHRSSAFQMTFCISAQTFSVAYIRSIKKTKETTLNRILRSIPHKCQMRFGSREKVLLGKPRVRSTPLLRFFWECLSNRISDECQRCPTFISDCLSHAPELLRILIFWLPIHESLSIAEVR